MSAEARYALVNSPFTIFRSDSQRTDLLDESVTQTGLIALLLELIGKGYYVLFTAIKSDHHDDSALGLHSHANGYAADVWPLHSSQATDYIDAGDRLFRAFLADCAQSAWLYQIGLAGSADTGVNFALAGSSAFHDEGADHVHLSAT